MSSSLRNAALAGMLSSVYSYSLGEMPSKTVGVGLPLIELLPTQAPSLELAKRSPEDKRAITNTCYEWTLDGLGGTPLCAASATCLFTIASDGFLYEGCGQTSIAYDWITACYPYPQTQSGTPPVSETWCPASAPACGYYAFVYDIGLTFYNFGCSRTSFRSTARLVDSTSINALIGAFGVTVTDISTASDSETTFTPTDTEKSYTYTDEATGIAGSGSSEYTNPPKIKSNSRKKKIPLGPIIGGVVGGIFVIIAISVLLFCIRKKKRDKAARHTDQQAQQIPADPTSVSAYQSQQRYSELGVTEKPQPPAVAYMNPEASGYGRPASEKPLAGAYTNPATATYGQAVPHPHGNELGDDNISIQNPPPTYAQQPHHPHAFSASTQQQYPPSNYTELPNNGRQSIPPVSPVGTYNYSENSPAGASTYSPGGTLSSLAIQTPTGNTQSPSHELGATQQAGPAEMANVQPRPHEMSGTGGIARKPVRPITGMDMSGNPTSDNYPHELA